MATTAEMMTRIILNNLLQRWPGGALVSEAMAGVLAPSLSRTHELAQIALRVSVPFDTVLGTALGIGRSVATGDTLATLAAERFLTIISAATTPVSAVPVTTAVAATFSVPPPGGGSGFQPPQDWTARAVMEAIRRLGRVATVDLATFPARLALAAAVSSAAVLAPGIRSQPGTGAPEAGRRVHGQLERRYRRDYAPPNLVVTDRRVYGGFPATYTGPQLSQVFGSDFRLACLQTAWIDPNYGGKRNWASSFRGDITDLDRMAQWEIKPIGEALPGVLQETWYRLAYNYVADVWARENPPLAGRLGVLRPGGTWESSLCLPPIDVSSELGYAAIAVPMTIPALSGLVLYTVFSGPQVVDVAELSLLLYLWLRQEIQQRMQQLGELARQAEQVLRDMCRWIAEHWQTVLVIAAVAILIAVAVITAPVWAPAVAALLTGGAILGASAALILLLITRLGGSPEAGPDRGPIQPEGSLTTINFPGVSVTMNPQDVGKLLSGVEAIYGGSIAAVARALRPPVA